MAAGLKAAHAHGDPAMGGICSMNSCVTFHTLRLILTKSIYVFLSPGAVSASCHPFTRSTQSSRCPAWDPDRAAETGCEAHQSVFNWNPYGKYNSHIVVFYFSFHPECVLFTHTGSDMTYMVIKELLIQRKAAFEEDGAKSARFSLTMNGGVVSWPYMS